MRNYWEKTHWELDNIHLLKIKKMPFQRSFYLSCENISDNKELSLILESIRGEARIILLDEISFVQNWDRTIKCLVDLIMVVSFFTTDAF